MLAEPHRMIWRYIKSHYRRYGMTPTYAEIRVGTHKSQGSIQNSLKVLEQLGYLQRLPEKKRNLVLLKWDDEGIPILGEIAAGYLSLPCQDEVETYLPIAYGDRHPDDFALRVSGDSMIGDHIIEGDYAIVRRMPEGYVPVQGAIVAAYVQGEGTTLKRFFQEADGVSLQASNPKYAPMKFDGRDRYVEVQGVLIQVVRQYEMSG